MIADSFGLTSWQLHLEAPMPLADTETEPTTTAIDAVFEKLLAEIVRGTYRAGTRLPAERELSRTLGASRPTLREALRRLGEWNLVEPRRGSGVIVRPYRDWSIEVIAGYMRYGKPEAGQPSTSRMVLDMMLMRRALVTEVVRLIAPRVPKGGTAGARLAMARAWSMRNETSYAREDFEVLRSLAEVAQFTPGLWILNQLAHIYFDLASSLRMVVRPPDDYVQTHSKFFDLLESGDAAGASQLMAEYLDRHDAQITAVLGPMA
ncbi:MAG TPA: GntR family transcriptional regulator [Kofleriaceae bacterium]|nr:GntR family transcriptional regulator [Kofleriaceae bacterium]